MTSLTVKLKAPIDQRWSAGLAVEVRDLEKLVVRARSFSDTSIEVPPGRYLVTATLPDGQQAGADEAIDLKQDENKDVFVSFDGVELPPVLQSARSWQATIKDFVRPITEFLGGQSAALVQGNPCTVWLKADATSVPLTRVPVSQSTFDVNFANLPILLEIGSRRGMNTYIAIPIDEHGTTTVQWKLGPDGSSPIVRFDFNDGVLNSFFDYVQSGLAPQAKSLSRPLVRQAESYLADKKRSPLRAVIAAYVLLRANELEILDKWTENLYEYCKWLPDVLPIRMEYLARQGRHTDAVSMLVKLPELGMPWFRSGIVYAATRAKQYAIVYAATPAKHDVNVKLESDNEVAVYPAPRDSLAALAPALGKIAEKLDLTQEVAVLHDFPRIA